MCKTIAYVRVATVSQDGDNINLMTQINSLRKFATECGYVISDLFADIGPGDTPNRPGLKKALSKIKKGGIDNLLCTDLSRLSRDPKTLSDLMSLTWKGLKIITPTQVYDSSEKSRLIAGIEIGMCQTYLEDFIGKIKRGINRAKQF